MTKQVFVNVPEKYKDDEHSYPEFSSAVRQRFESLVTAGVVLFTTSVENLFDVFLSGLPVKDRQRYTCNECRRFYNRFGGLAVLDSEGNMIPVMWDEESTPSYFRKAVAKMIKAIQKSEINGMFYTDERKLGTPITGEWMHMAVDTPQHILKDGKEAIRREPLKTLHAIAADRKQEHEGLERSIGEFSSEVVEKAITMLKSGTLFRADRFIGMAEWFRDLKAKMDSIRDTKKKHNLIWAAVASAPTGFAYIRSRQVGTLMKDLNDGLSVSSIKSRWDEKMDNYQQSQTGPSDRNLYEAEKLVTALGVGESLNRRYPTFEEIPHMLWTDKGAEHKPIGEKKSSGGVFGHVKTREAAAAPSADGLLNLPMTTMTWDKFLRTELSRAQSIDVLVQDANRMMAIVAAANKEAPNILLWDNEYSWYYNGGKIDNSEFKRRVERDGGRYADVDIRCSLIWNGHTDLDLHAFVPGGHIYYAHGNRRVGHGWLDIDANGMDGLKDEPVENIRWETGRAPSGVYKFVVHNYNQRGKGPVPFEVELVIDGKNYSFSGVAGTTNWEQTIFTFNYVKGQLTLVNSSRGTQSSSSEFWGVQANTFVKVKGITNSPNLWGENKAEHIGHHVFFLLEGCKDDTEDSSRGFITETLKSEFRPHRKALEAFAAQTPIEGAEEASACGVGYSKDSKWDVTLKVTSGNSTRLIKIDRFD